MLTIIKLYYYSYYACIHVPDALMMLEDRRRSVSYNQI